MWVTHVTDRGGCMVVARKRCGQRWGGTMARTGRGLGLVAGAALLLIASPASADIITFDDLAPPVFEHNYNAEQIPNGYQGLTWSTYFWVLDTTSYQNWYPSSGYENGTVSQDNVAFNFAENDVSFSSATPFTLNSFYLTAAWQNQLNVQIDASLGGTSVYSMLWQVGTSGPTSFISPNVLADLVTFHSEGGTDAGFIANDGNPGCCTHFAIDNLSVDVNSVPLPAALPLFASGLVGLGWLSRRRRKQAAA